MYMLLHIYVYFQAYMCMYIDMLENKDNTVVFFLSGGVGKEEECILQT